MCTSLYFYFCIWYNMLATKNLFSVRHHAVDPLYAFLPPPSPFPSGNCYSVLCIYVFGLFSHFDFVCLFIRFFIFHI